MRRLLTWSFWQNPFSDEDEYVTEDQAEPPEPWEDTEEEPQIKVRPVVPVQNMGFVPVQIYQSFTKNFPFWLADTNFDVDDEVFNIVDTIPGVEGLSVVSRYRFRICIGRLFNTQEVKLSVQRALNAMPPTRGEENPQDIVLDEETKGRVQVLKNVMNDKFNYWAIYLLPNGEIAIAGSDDKDKYNEQIALYRDTQSIAGGVVYTNE